MNKRLPYESFFKEQLNNLPLPDENKAWDDMRRRLEDEEDDKPIVAWWRRGCMPFGLLLIVLLGISLWLRPDKWFDKKLPTSTTVAEKLNQQKENRVKPDSLTTINMITDSILQNKNNNKMQEADDTSSIATNNLKTNSIVKVASENLRKPLVPIIVNAEVKTKTKQRDKKPTHQTVKNIRLQKNKTKEKPKAKNRVTNILLPNPNLTETEELNSNKNKKETKVISEPITEQETKLSSESGSATASTDESLKIKKKLLATKDSVIKKDNIENEAEIIVKNKMAYSAGIGLQQQLPFAGQKWNPYNAQGRKGSLTDYIPSVYFRLSKPGKWFLQSAFRYGAPQLTKEILYKQITIPDSAINPRFTTTISNFLKKTYYHQVPLTFNYYVSKSWSVGAGLQWNSFKAAVAEQKQSTRNNVTQQDSLYFKQIVKVNNDSANNFKKTYLQGIIETQYKWKRFSLGARYNFGLQPYLQFTLPGGAPQKEKNSTMQLFIHYELWRKNGK